MKRLILTICICFMVCLAHGQNTFQSAEELYRQGKFSAALQEYETALKDYPNDPFLYYNIGNCYFKMGSRGLAVANYYRAFRLAPRDKDIRHNLALTLEASGEKLVPAGVPVILHKAFFSLSSAELKGLVYVLFWAVCICVIICLLRRRWSVAFTVVCVIWLMSAGWLYFRLQQDNENCAVIAVPVAEIRSGPGTNFPASANIGQGHLVTILDDKDSWYEVVVSSQGLKGWIDKNALEKI